jgi:hypothetical protein
MEESKRIKEQRNQELRNEALNPVPEAEETGRDNKDKSKAIRDNKVEDEFDSKDIGPGGYGDRNSMPLTERKMRKDAEIRREEELKQKKDKQRRKEEEAGRENKDKSKAIRNASSYDEFGSKKAGPGGYSDRPLTERKMRKDPERRREEELKQAEKEKKDKQRRKEERQKDWGE